MWTILVNRPSITCHQEPYITANRAAWTADPNASRFDPCANVWKWANMPGTIYSTVTVQYINAGEV